MAATHLPQKWIRAAVGMRWRDEGLASSSNQGPHGAPGHLWRNLQRAEQQKGICQRSQEEQQAKEGWKVQEYNFQGNKTSPACRSDPGVVGKYSQGLPNSACSWDGQMGETLARPGLKDSAILLAQHRDLWENWHLCNISLSLQEHSLCFCPLGLSLISSSKALSFSPQRACTPIIKFITLLYFVAIANCILKLLLQYNMKYTNQVYSFFNMY